MLSQKIGSMEPIAAPEDAYKLEAQEDGQSGDSGGQEPAEEKHDDQLAVSLCLLTLALGSLWWFLFRPKGGDVRISNRMIEIPGGEFVISGRTKSACHHFTSMSTR